MWVDPKGGVWNPLWVDPKGGVWNPPPSRVCPKRRVWNAPGFARNERPHVWVDPKGGVWNPVGGSEGGCLESYTQPVQSDAIQAAMRVGCLASRESTRRASNLNSTASRRASRPFQRHCATYQSVVMKRPGQRTQNRSTAVSWHSTTCCTETGTQLVVVRLMVLLDLLGNPLSVRWLNALSRLRGSGQQVAGV